MKTGAAIEHESSWKMTADCRDHCLAFLGSTASTCLIARRTFLMHHMWSAMNMLLWLTSCLVRSSVLILLSLRLYLTTRHHINELANFGLQVGLVTADCECGYSTNVDGSRSPYLFTDILESDFLHIRNISYDTDWRRQEFSVTAAAGRGLYGMNYTVANVVSNPIANLTQWTGPGQFGPDPGLQISVDSGIPIDGYVKVAEMNSAREDMLWGSYRAAMQLTNVSGTCAAFFWVWQYSVS